jgi:tetratricopeptide (TPR) repeat protein
LAHRGKAILMLACVSCSLWSQEVHDHGVPEKLGRVSFPISCTQPAQAEFNRGVALLHSFAYSAAEASFSKAAGEDPGCAMAHWGSAMTCFHQLWEPHLPEENIAVVKSEIEAARKAGGTRRERAYIQALSLILPDSQKAPFSTRALRYEQAMGELASTYSDDVEAKIFFALALIATAPPGDKTHSHQKQALAILEPLDLAYPDHPGITHYVIHACDSGELASNGLSAARKYALIAPSAPHALHMPSHIFTRLGLWQDSIASNLAASRAAREQGDIGEELHAMDYLVYAYLQLGRYDEADQVIEHLKSVPRPGTGEFKIVYAATAMPVRFAVEQHNWDSAAKMTPQPGSPPYVAALAVWARGLGRARGEHPSGATSEIATLQQLEEQLRGAGDEYWATQVQILRKEVVAWAAQASERPEEAETTMRAAADEEDATEKLPVTPGPVVPAREQLGELLLEQQRPSEAVMEFRTALVNAPGRRGATQGLERAMHSMGVK